MCHLLSLLGVNVVDGSPLLRAIQAEPERGREQARLPVIRLLLDAAADPNHVFEGTAPFIEAASRELSEALFELRRSGGSPDLQVAGRSVRQLIRRPLAPAFLRPKWRPCTDYNVFNV